ncbi:MAG: RNA-directed DNA polymerase [Pseudomonadales bacterium]
MTVSKSSLQLAVKNMQFFGDTDVFPRPFELLAVKEQEDKFIQLLEELDANFDAWFVKHSPTNIRAQSAVGYHGFRAATQIDVPWNAYLLALVIEIGEELEAERVSTSNDTVYSYRLALDATRGTLFDSSIGWQAFNEKSVSLAETSSHVLVTDIADFYSRIYHHRLENALKKIEGANPEVVRRIVILVSSIAGVVSYGLPVGGPAARLLSELLLNRVDRLLLAGGIQFIRFVDDYRIFATDEEHAYRSLVSLSDFLLRNEGLTLNRSKTRILTRHDFLATSAFTADERAESAEEAELRDFLKLRLKYDPYSPTADEDYDKLLSELMRFDIVGLLMREIRKSRIDERVTRQLLQSIKLLSPSTRNAAIESLVDNLIVLYPVFPSVMTVLLASYDDLTKVIQGKVFSALKDLISKNSYITQVPANLAFALRVLAFDRSEECDAVLSQLYQSTTDMMVRRDLIYVMAYRDSEWWLSNLKNSYSMLTMWERRAMVVASYILQDEGRHWRDSVKSGFDPYTSFLRDWAAASKNQNGSLSIRP